MPAKRRKVLVDPELLKELEALERRRRQTDREIERTLQKADEVQRELRAIYQRR